MNNEPEYYEWDVVDFIEARNRVRAVLSESFTHQPSMEVQALHEEVVFMPDYEPVPRIDEE